VATFIYHDICLQNHENKCLHCLKYIKNPIEINVKSVINNLTREDDLPIENDPEDEIQSLEHDEPEELEVTFNLQAESQFDTALNIFLRN